jgi:4-amino-4-deoxychorismate lyase
MMETTTLVNGQSTHSISIFDRGLAYGDGLFETIALVNGQIQLWHLHKQRLLTGLLSLKLVASNEEAESLLSDVVTDVKTGFDLFKQPNGVLKITITRGVGGRGYAPPIHTKLSRIIAFTPWPNGRDYLARDGVTVRMCKHRWSQNSALVGLKHLNRLDQVIARSEWSDPDIHEGIMLNQQAKVCSGAMSNLFVEFNGALLTPKLDNCGIHGTMAQFICSLAQDMQVEVIHTDITIEHMLEADGLFLTNSINGIWPVVKLHHSNHDGDAATLSWSISELTNRLQKTLSDQLAKQPLVASVC